MVFHDALVRDNHDYANHDVGEKYYSNPTEDWWWQRKKPHIKLVAEKNFIGLQVWWMVRFQRGGEEIICQCNPHEKHYRERGRSWRS